MLDVRRSALVSCLTLAACHSSTTTGVRVHVSFGGVAAQQIEFTVLAADGTTSIVPPTLRPQTPQGNLASPQDVVIYLPDSAAGTVVCRARAAAASDQRPVAVAVHQIADVALSLTAATGDGGTDGLPPPPDGGLPDASSDVPATNRENGQACSDGSQCASTYCADGVCCASSCVGLCRACNLTGSVGTCTAVAAGKPAEAGECPASDPSSCGPDGTCNGMGACTAHYPAGTVCQAATCVALTSMMPPSRCSAAGACVPPVLPTMCDPFVCDSATGKCVTTCTTSAQCAPPHGCVGGGCGGLKPNGDTCAAATECNSGHCSDGYCCNIDCSSSCVACNVAGAEGTCTALPAGAVDPRGMCADQGSASCGTSGLCNGNGGCPKYGTGTICVPASCAGSTLSAARTCDGNGTCQPGAMSPCPGNFVCSSLSACYTKCTTDAQCAAGTCKSPPGKCM